jgi:hypothetical protein
MIFLFLHFSYPTFQTGPSWHKMLRLSELLGKATVSNLHLCFERERVSEDYSLVDDARSLS